MGEGYVVEFGSDVPIHVMRPGEMIMYDGENGMPILCECGKPAESGLIGTETFLARCNECMYGKSDEL